MYTLITGVAGFVGHSLCKALLRKNINVIGIDNLNSYYDQNLKRDRVKDIISLNSNFIFKKIDIRNTQDLKKIFEKNSIDYIVHLAAQAGVRYSTKHPEEVIDNNISGFMNILDVMKEYEVKHLVYASSSAVYNNNTPPFHEEDNTDKQISIYGATKKSNELMAHVYSNMYDIPTTGLRLFSIYGPWLRPDLAMHKFTKSILSDKQIKVYNNGNQYRDFTYIDDAVNIICQILTKIPEGSIPYEIYNISNGTPIYLMDVIKLIEQNLNKRANIKILPENIEEMRITHANLSKIKNIINHSPKVDIEAGIHNFIKWYKGYYT